LKTSPFQGKPLEQIAFCHWRLQMLRNSITPRLQNLETATSFKLTEQERAWLTEAEKMTDVMIKENSSNQLAYILKADIFGLSNRPQDQIAYFKKALDLGELDHLRSWQFLVFLTKYSTDAEIEKVIGRINHHNDPKLMRLLFETYLRLGKKANAQELMAALAPNEKNASQIDKFWYAQALRATNDKAKSLAILQQLVEEDVKFELPDAWLELLSTYIRENNTAAADTLLKKMAALPPSERLDMTLFRLRESMGDMTGAKAMLDQALAKYPENFSIMINAIEFHIRTNNPATALNQAEKLLEKCRANKDKPEGAQQLQTAELVYALASSKLDPSYAKFNETDAKFEKAMYNGDELSVLVLAKRVQLLLDRKEPVSVRKAIKLMELLAQKQPLTYGDKVRLARMYNMVGDQVNSRKTIESLMNESSKTNPDLSYMYAELQYDNGKYGDAKGHLENYISRTRPEGRVDTSFLMAKILVKLNQGAAGAKLLSDSLGPRPLNEQSFFRLQAAAKLLEELKQIPEAEKLYAELGQLNPTGKAHYARFVGCHVDSRKGLQLLEEVASKDAEPVLRVCISSGTAIVRFIRNRDQFSEVQNYYNAITKWFDRLKALEAQNSTATIETDMIQAEVNEVQGKLQESIDIYRRLLDSKKLNPLGQAGIQNNLAYMQILLGTAPALKDARVQINQAIDFMGPQSDLLDTRGTISLFEGNYQAALRDFEDAVLDRSDAKFFHLALAHFKLKNNNAALEALDKAKNYNFVPQDLHAVEKKLYNEMMIGLGQKP
jgi:tetratricopeptide (TPR) repeat protein